MPPKKKVAKTEEMPTETETITEKVENTEVPNEEVENIQKPKKPKRKMTEKQQENFAKLQLANKERYEAKRKLKEQETNNKIQEVEVKQEEKKEIKNYNKSFGLKNDKPPPKQEVAEEEEEEEEQEVIVKKKPVKKKKKQKIIIEEDSSSDSENEIIIRRSRGRKKSKPINIPQEQPTPEPIDITPIEETKKEEPIELTKKYTAQQILKGLGF
jgi:hypothetical protein